MIVGVYGILSGNAGVTAIAADRISPDVRNRGDVFPSITFQITNVDSTEFADGSGPPRFGSVNIDAIARTRIDAEALADAIVLAIELPASYPSDCLITGRVDSRSANEYQERGGDTDLVYVSSITATFTEAG